MPTSSRANTGGFASESEALQAIVGRLAEVLRPASIWLFGSRAKGAHRPDSDFDLLVVTRIENGEAGRDYEGAYSPVKGLGVGCDIVPIRLDDLLDEMDHPNSMFADIMRNGIKVYGGRNDKFVSLPRGRGIGLSEDPVEEQSMAGDLRSSRRDARDLRREAGGFSASHADGASAKIRRRRERGR